MEEEKEEFTLRSLGQQFAHFMKVSADSAIRSERMLLDIDTVIGQLKGHEERFERSEKRISGLEEVTARSEEGLA